MPQKLKLKKIQPETMKEHFGSIESSSERVILPSISLNSNQVSEIKDWEPPEKYRLVIDIEQTSKSMKKGKTTADFNIIAYKYIPKKDIFDMNDKEFGEEQGKRLSGK